MKDVVFIILYDSSNKILIQHIDKYGFNFLDDWCFLGGNIEDGETPVQTITREMKNIFGIKLDNPKLLFSEFIDKKGKEHINYYFSQKLINKNKIDLKKGQDLKWIRCNEIYDMNSRKDLKSSIKKIKSMLF